MNSINSLLSTHVFRYFVNGIFATTVHYTILVLNIEVVALESAAFSNLIAVFFGIITSFLGSRYYVFQSIDEPALRQAKKFIGLYGVIALLHWSLMLVWVDWNGMDYRIGFLIATLLQVTLSYFGNKYLVFNT